jgi:hypothetical protein
MPTFPPHKAKKCIFFVRVFWPRRSRGLKTGGDKRQRCTLDFLGDARTTKQKTSLQTLQIYFASTFFRLIHINNFFFSSIRYQLANTIRNLLFAIQLLIYIIYGDRTIIGFVGFVANLLNRPTDGATVSIRKCVRKRVTFRPLVST